MGIVYFPISSTTCYAQNHVTNIVRFHLTIHFSRPILFTHFDSRFTNHASRFTLHVSRTLPVRICGFTSFNPMKFQELLPLATSGRKSGIFVIAAKIGNTLLFKP